MKIELPTLSLVALIGTSGSGMSTFAKTHFKPTEVLSSDYCRGLVSEDENDQIVTKDACEVLHYTVAKRLAAGRLTVIDVTNVQVGARKPTVKLARGHDVLPAAIDCVEPSGGVAKVVCQEKHMGSRTVAVVCCDEDVAAKCFGIPGQDIGTLYTQTGRPFFDDRSLDSALRDPLCTALKNADFWERCKSDGFCLDAELMPTKITYGT